MKYIVFLVGALLIPSLSMAQRGVGSIDVAPDTIDYGAKAEIPLEVRIRAPESITSFRIHLKYDPAMLEVSEVKPNKETFPYWWRQEAANGVIELEASLPKPGFKGESLVAGVVLTAKEAGSELLEIDEDASLLLNAQGENILKAQASSGENGPVLADFGSGRFGVALGILVFVGVVFGIVMFLRGRKK